MSTEGWKVLHQRVLVERPPWLRLIEQRVQLDDGRVIDGYLLIEAPAYVAIFGVREDGLIVAVEEYRHGLGRTTLKLPAGYLEPDEPPLLAAQRELLEETGYAAAAWRFLGAFHNDGNRGMSRGHYFLATGLRQVAAPRAGDLAAVRPLLLTAAELRQALRDGRVGESSAAAAMFLGLDALQMAG